MFDDHQLIQQGWQCPVCKRVYSPATYVCWYCGGSGCTATTKTVTNDPEQLAEKYKKMLDEVITSDGIDYEVLLNLHNIHEMMRWEAYRDAEGTADGSGQEGGAGPEG